MISRSSVQADLFSIGLLFLDEGSLFLIPPESDPEDYDIHCSAGTNFKHPNSQHIEDFSLLDTFLTTQIHLQGMYLEGWQELPHTQSRFGK